MKFRKNSILYYDLEIFYIVMVLFCLGLIPMLGLELSIPSAFLFVILVLVNPGLHDEFITIDASGIMCEKSGTLLWSYGWDGVAELKKSSRFRMPSVEIITYDKSGEPEPFSLPNHFFQLGRAARKALKQYDKSGDLWDH